MANRCNTCGTGSPTCCLDHEQIQQFWGFVPEDHHFGMNVPCRGVWQFRHYIKRYFTAKTSHGSSYRMYACDDGDTIGIGGDGWDSLCYDYDLKAGDQIHFRYDCVHFVMYVSPIHPTGEPKNIIPDIYDEEGQVVMYSNDCNLTPMQRLNMTNITNVYPQYPAQIHCFNAANVHENIMLIHRPIVGRLGLQQFGSVLLEMHRDTHRPLEVPYQIKPGGRLEIKGGSWKTSIYIHDIGVCHWVVILAIPSLIHYYITLRFKTIGALAVQDYSSDEDGDDSDNKRIIVTMERRTDLI